MWRQGRLHIGILGWTLLVAGAAPAADAIGSPAEMLPADQTPTPIEDDAQLHDVHFVGRRLGWVVGDHGVIWHTRDGGETWSLQASGVECPLHSVCFLTDRV